MAENTPQALDFAGLRYIPVDEEPTYDESKQKPNPKDIISSEPLQLNPSTNKSLPSAVQPLPTPKDVLNTTVEGAKQAAQATRNIGQGPSSGSTIQDDVHDLVVGGMKAGTVPMMFAAAADPMLLAEGVAESAAGGAVAKQGAKALGASPENQQLAEDIGSVAAPTAIRGIPTRPEGSAFLPGSETGAVKIGGDPFKGLRVQEIPSTVYRTRPEGQEGITTTQGSHAHATANESEANMYRQSLDEMSAQKGENIKHNVDAIDLSKIPSDQYQIMKGPNGHDWVKFTKDQPESIFNKPEEKTAIKVSTDNNGVKWAENKDGVKVSIPNRIPESQVQDYAAKQIDEQAKMQADIKAKTAPREPTQNVINDAKKITGPTKIQIGEHDGNVEIKSIETPEDERSKGYASKALSQLTDIADKHGVRLQLNANPFETGKNRLGYDELKDFYKKHGFEEKFAPGTEESAKETDYDPEYGHMIREPKSTSPETQTISTRVPTATKATGSGLSEGTGSAANEGKLSSAGISGRQTRNGRGVKRNITQGTEGLAKKI